MCHTGGRYQLLVCACATLAERKTSFLSAEGDEVHGHADTPNHTVTRPACCFQVTYKMKQKKKRGVGSEMRFGVNTAAPFVGLKREEATDYPYSKQVSGMSSVAVDRLRSIDMSATSTKRAYIQGSCTMVDENDETEHHLQFSLSVVMPEFLRLSSCASIGFGTQTVEMLDWLLCKKWRTNLHNCRMGS